MRDSVSFQPPEDHSRCLLAGAAVALAPGIATGAKAGRWWQVQMKSQRRRIPSGLLSHAHLVVARRAFYGMVDLILLLPLPPLGPAPAARRRAPAMLFPLWSALRNRVDGFAQKERPGRMSKQPHRQRKTEVTQDRHDLADHTDLRMRAVCSRAHNSTRAQGEPAMIPHLPAPLRWYSQPLPPLHLAVAHEHRPKLRLVLFVSAGSCAKPFSRSFLVSGSQPH